MPRSHPRRWFLIARNLLITGAPQLSRRCDSPVQVIKARQDAGVLRAGRGRLIDIRSLRVVIFIVLLCCLFVCLFLPSGSLFRLYGCTEFKLVKYLVFWTSFSISVASFCSSIDSTGTEYYITLPWPLKDNLLFLWQMRNCKVMIFRKTEELKCSSVNCWPSRGKYFIVKWATAYLYRWSAAVLYGTIFLTAHNWTIPGDN